MTTSEAIRIALLSLWANKLRSVLTLLGVVIGVSAVIAVVTFVNGINGYVAEKVFNLGADVFIISKMPNVITDVDQFIEGNKRKDMTMENYQAVAEECSACKIVGAAVRNFTGKVVYGTENSTDTVVRGWTPTMEPIYDLDVVMGRPLNDADQNIASQVIVIASISLIVGGIVIMNIMLVSVTERTREIGIRKALGARPRDVMRQFLIESSTMALIGGLIGVIGGIAIAEGVTAAIGMPSEIKLWAIAAGLLVSASVGIFFGVYPARQAAKLDPIVALRFEL